MAFEENKIKPRLIHHDDGRSCENISMEGSMELINRIENSRFINLDSL